MTAKPARCKYRGFGRWSCGRPVHWEVSDPHVPDKAYKACTRHVGLALIDAEYETCGHELKVICTDNARRRHGFR